MPAKTQNNPYNSCIRHLHEVKVLLEANMHPLPVHLVRHFNKKIRKVSEKGLVTLPKELKFSFCRVCFNDVVVDERVTNADGRQYHAVYCPNCQKVVRKLFVDRKSKAKHKV